VYKTMGDTIQQTTRRIQGGVRGQKLVWIVGGGGITDPRPNVDQQKTNSDPSNNVGSKPLMKGGDSYI